MKLATIGGQTCRRFTTITVKQIHIFSYAFWFYSYSEASAQGHEMFKTTVACIQDDGVWTF
jgi:hypothetical protein